MKAHGSECTFKPVVEEERQHRWEQEEEAWRQEKEAEVRRMATEDKARQHRWQQEEAA